MKRVVATLVVAMLATASASVSLLATPAPVSAACFYGTNQTSQKSLFEGGATLTSTVVYQIGYTCNSQVSQVHVVSMKLKVTGTEILEPQFLTRMEYDAADNYPSPSQVYVPKDFPYPYPSCDPHFTGSCTLGPISSGTLPWANNEAAYSNSRVAVYIGNFEWQGCPINIYHKFLANSLYTRNFC